MTTQLPFKFFDCDNHYYEALDAFTRHIEPQYKKRAIQWAELDGKQRLIVGGRVNRFIPNPTFDPVGKPGALDEYAPTDSIDDRADTSDTRGAAGRRLVPAIRPRLAAGVPSANRAARRTDRRTICRSSLNSPHSHHEFRCDISRAVQTKADSRAFRVRFR